jgi:hypothetical protein
MASLKITKLTTGGDLWKIVKTMWLQTFRVLRESEAWRSHKRLKL